MQTPLQNSDSWKLQDKNLVSSISTLQCEKIRESKNLYIKRDLRDISINCHVRPHLDPDLSKQSIKKNIYEKNEHRGYLIVIFLTY